MKDPAPLHQHSRSGRVSWKRRKFSQKHRRSEPLDRGGAWTPETEKEAPTWPASREAEVVKTDPRDRFQKKHQPPGVGLTLAVPTWFQTQNNGGPIVPYRCEERAVNLYFVFGSTVV